jgi:hypothetical protein
VSGPAHHVGRIASHFTDPHACYSLQIAQYSFRLDRSGNDSVNVIGSDVGGQKFPVAKSTNLPDCRKRHGAPLTVKEKWRMR